MATKNSKNKAGKNHILKNPVVIVFGVYRYDGAYPRVEFLHRAEE